MTFDYSIYKTDVPIFKRSNLYNADVVYWLLCAHMCGLHVICVPQPVSLHMYLRVFWGNLKAL